MFMLFRIILCFPFLCDPRSVAYQKIDASDCSPRLLPLMIPLPCHQLIHLLIHQPLIAPRFATRFTSFRLFIYPGSFVSFPPCYPLMPMWLPTWLPMWLPLVATVVSSSSSHSMCTFTHCSQGAPHLSLVFVSTSRFLGPRFIHLMSCGACKLSFKLALN